MPTELRIEPLGTFAFDQNAREGFLDVGHLVSDQAVPVVVKLGFPLAEPGARST